MLSKIPILNRLVVGGSPQNDCSQQIYVRRDDTVIRRILRKPMIPTKIPTSRQNISLY